MGASDEELDAAQKEFTRRLKEEEAAANAELVRKEAERKLQERVAEDERKRKEGK